MKTPFTENLEIINQKIKDLPESVTVSEIVIRPYEFAIKGKSEEGLDFETIIKDRRPIKKFCKAGIEVEKRIQKEVRKSFSAGNPKSTQPEF